MMEENSIDGTYISYDGRHLSRFSLNAFGYAGLPQSKLVPFPSTYTRPYINLYIRRIKNYIYV